MTPEPITFPRDEEWLEMRASADYLMSTHGRCYSVVGKCILRPKVQQPSNRLRVFVRTDRGNRGIAVATEVLRLFSPDQKRRRVPAYRDGDIRNCRLDNLYWVDSNTPAYREADERIQQFALGAALREADQAVADDEAAASAAAESTVGQSAGSARPGGIVTPSRVAEAMAARRTHADLSAEEKRLIKEWYVARGGSNRGRLSADVIAGYDHEHEPLAGLGAT